MRQVVRSTFAALLVGLWVGSSGQAAAQAPRVRVGTPPAMRRIEAPRSAVRVDSLERLAPISGGLASRLAAPPSREVMLRSILADPAARTVLARRAEASGKTVDQLVTERVAPGAEPPSPTTVTDEPTGSSDASEAAYQQVDWKAGVAFTLLSIPTYGPTDFPLGNLDVGFARVQTWRQGAVFLDVPVVTGVSYGTITLEAELPLEPAMYMVAVRLVGGGGQCPASWVQTGTTGWPAIHITVTDAADQPQFIPLADGSGYVGLCALTPRVYTSGAGPFEGMRRKTSTIYVSISRASAVPAMGLLVFGGITVTRL